MLSFTSLKALYGQFTNNATATNLTNGATYINNALRQIYSAAPWDFMERLATIPTVASQQFYDLPNDYDKLIATSTLIGSVQYIPKEVADKTTWDFLNQNTNITSNIPAYYFILDGQIGFYPKPSSGGNTIQLTYRVKAADLSLEDQAAATMSVTSGGTTVTGLLGNFYRGLVGQWLRFYPNTTSNTTSGDGKWYKIASVTDTTHLELEQPYAGGTVTSGSGKIGEMPLLPETYQMMPVYMAAVWYWNANGNPQKAKYWNDLAAEMMKQLRADRLSKTTDDSIKDIVGGAMQNPNLYVMN